MAEVRGDDLGELCAAVDANTEAAFGGAGKACIRGTVTLGVDRCHSPRRGRGFAIRSETLVYSCPMHSVTFSDVHAAARAVRAAVLGSPHRSRPRAAPPPAVSGAAARGAGRPRRAGPRPAEQQASFVHVKIVTKHKPHEQFAAPVVEREDDSMYEGETRSSAPAARRPRRDLPVRLSQRQGRQPRKVRTRTCCGSRGPRSSGSAPQEPCGGLGPARAVRVRRQLGHQHRQRLLRRPAVQPRHLAGLRRPGLPEPAPAARPRSPSRRRSATPPVATAPGRAAPPRSGLPALARPLT